LQGEEQMLRLLIRGSNDVGSAVAWLAHRRGFAVLIHDGAQPLTSRRGMSFTDAIFAGEVSLDGVNAWRVDALEPARAREGVLITCSPFEQCLAMWRPDVVVDARLRKRIVPEVQLGLAPLVIGIGPNFTTGAQVHLAVESSYGNMLGAVVRDGSTLPLAGEPRPIEGRGRDRFVYASCAGKLQTGQDIGDLVQAGAVVATLDGAPVRAPIDGAIRGLVHDGCVVPVGTKILEIDPRGTSAQVFGLGERPRIIAEGVLYAIQSRFGVA
jgi:xanthine dehydrogenase accessory factor